MKHILHVMFVVALTMVLVCALGTVTAQAASSSSGIGGPAISGGDTGNSISQSGTCGPWGSEDSLTWTLRGGILTISGTGEMEFYDTYTRAPWYDYRRSIESVNIMNGVASIGDYAFFWFPELTNITIPNSVTAIGDYAFSDCYDLTDVSIPSSVTSIGDYAFSNCFSLANVTIPDGTTSIGDRVFLNCSALAGITIPNSVTTIGYRAFDGCSQLTSAGPIGGGYSIQFGWTKEIPASAFSGCDTLIRVTIPDSVTSIRGYAFSGCSALTSVTIPNRVTSIGGYAFSSCPSLTSVTIPSSVTFIDGEAFFDCPRLTNAGPIGGKYHIQFGWTEEIPDYAFCGCDALISVTIPDSVTSIGERAFSHCRSLTNVVIPNGVTSIEDYTFNYCSALTGVVIPDNVTSIGQGSFSSCSALTGVVIPDNVPSIGQGSFSSCSALTGVVIPDGVTAIKDYTFSSCSDLVSVMIPDSVTSIGYGAFSSCDRLTDVYYGGSEADWRMVNINSWSNTPLTSATIHYTSPVATPTLSSGDNTLSFSYSEHGRLTLSSGEVPWDETVFAACYDENGKLTGIKPFTYNRCSANIGKPDHFKLIWVNSGLIPQCEAVTVTN